MFNKRIDIFILFVYAKQKVGGVGERIDIFILFVYVNKRIDIF